MTHHFAYLAWLNRLCVVISLFYRFKWTGGPYIWTIFATLYYFLSSKAVHLGMLLVRPNEDPVALSLRGRTCCKPYYSVRWIQRLLFLHKPALLLLVPGLENSLSAILNRTECKERIIPVIMHLLHSIRKQMDLQCHPLTKRSADDAQ
jgi:hypothetical protein